tara:strand:+ start:2336 stop:3589 length:1254 start_codon:yes stop_codon:yes gene_type:complete
MPQSKFDVTVIGAGRVGLPLALLMESKGLKVAIKERNLKIIKSIKLKKSPFKEKDVDNLLLKTKIKCFNNNLPFSKYYLITVGTPLKQNIETDLSQIIEVVNDIIKKVKIKNSTIILRSTVAPNTTKFISEYIENKTKLKLGKDFFLSYCPERIVEGNAIKELSELPQIIGVNDQKSWVYSKILFKYLLSEKKIFKGSWSEAELSKLFSNIYRYINFAIPNYFMMIANHFKVEPFSLFDLMNSGYERNKGLKDPGLTAGTCLRKDYGMINENFPHTDLILQAHKINEFMPMFLTNLIKPEHIKNKKIGILGYVFKKDTDDTRDSLTPKIFRYISKLVPKKINISDYNLPRGIFKDEENKMNFKNLNEKDLIKDSDIIIIAMNHTHYENLIKKTDLRNKIIIDPWRVLAKKLVNNYGK